MSLILRKGRFERQPQYPAPLDTNGLGRDVKILLNPGAGLRDLSGGNWTLAGNTSLRGSPGGRSLYFDQAGSSVANLTSPDISSTAGTFFLYAARIGAPDTFGTVFLSTSTGNNKYFHVHEIASSAIDWGVGGGQTTGVDATKIFNTVNTSLVFTTDGTGGAGKVFYLNGVPVGTGDATAPPTFSAGANSLVLGAYWGGSSWDLDGDILIAGYATRMWSPGEAQKFNDRPWSVYQAPPRRLFAVSAAAPGGSNIFSFNPPMRGGMRQGGGFFQG